MPYSCYFYSKITIFYSLLSASKITPKLAPEAWWFSWNDIVGLYKLKISLTWQESSVFYLSCGIRFKSDMQQYIVLYPTPIQHNQPPPQC